MCCASPDWRSRFRLPSILLFAAIGLGTPAAVEGQTASATGWLSAVFTEAEPPAPPLRYFLHPDRGAPIELLLDDRLVAALGGEALRAGFRARVDYRPSAGQLRQGPPGATPAQRAVTVSRLSAPGRLTLPGAVSTVPYLTILCRFADVPSEPFTAAQVQTRMGSGYPGADNYFSELSEGQVSLSGSITVGWYGLPQARSAYISGTSADLVALTGDCLGAADPDVDYTQYRGVILQFNAGLSVRATAPYDTLSFGGSSYVSLDGANRSFPMVWMSREHVYNYVVLHHELGHSLGWPHSSGPYSNTYDSRWDIMSRGYIYNDPVYGWLGPHTIAYHKDLSGWIPANRRWRLGSGDPPSFLLLRSALPPAGPGYQAAVLRIPGGSRYYTLESRLVAGYDRGFPGDGIVIHEVNPARADRTAEVVDPDQNGDPNDAAATWVPGETFMDAAAGIAVQVDSAVPEGYWVTVGGQGWALAARSRARTVQVGDAGVYADSVGVQVFGPAAATADWTATHVTAATWTSLVTASGTGSGMVRWTRRPGGLAEGVYVDTITVAVPAYPAAIPYLVDSLVVAAPLGVAVFPLSGRDSVPQGSTALRSGAATLSLSGFGADTAAWTLTHGAAAWISLVNGSGSGGGSLLWERHPAGLTPGVYVDTLMLTISRVPGSPIAILDSMFVYEPAVSVSCASTALTGRSSCLGSVERVYLDATGNQDGAYNLGDLLAYLDRKGLSLPPSLLQAAGAAAGGRSAAAPGTGASSHRGPT